MKRLAAVDLLAATDPFETGFSRERVIQARPMEPSVDWPLVVTLRRRASERISAAIGDHDGPLTTVDRRLLGRSIVQAVVREHVDALTSKGEALWPVAVEQAYAQ